MEDKKEIFEIVNTPFHFSVELIFSKDRLKSVMFTDKKPDLRVNHSLSDVWDRMKRYFYGEKVDFNIPIILECLTEFEKKVLRLTHEIKYGEVLTYKELAIRLGNKNLSRAVGNALRKNPLPIVIPCHRVIGSDGSLCGFMGKEGLEIKKILLKLEKSL